MVQETKNETKNHKSITLLFEEIKSEARKVVWPTRKDLIKQTGTVIVVSIIFSAVIVAYDAIFGFGLDAFSSLLAR